MFAFIAAMTASASFIIKNFSRAAVQVFDEAAAEGTLFVNSSRFLVKSFMISTAF